jgi:hypothetical protein
MRTDIGRTPTWSCWPLIVTVVGPDEIAVNEALRVVMQLARIPRADGDSVVET